MKKYVTAEDLSYPFLKELMRVKSRHVPAEDFLVDMRAFGLVKDTEKGVRLTVHGEEVVEDFSPFNLRDELFLKMLARLEQWRNNAKSNLADLKYSMDELNKRLGPFLVRVNVYVEGLEYEPVQERQCGVWFEFYKKIKGYSIPVSGWVVGTAHRVEDPAPKPSSSNETPYLPEPGYRKYGKGSIYVQVTQEELDKELHRSRCHALSGTGATTTVTSIPIDYRAARRGR